MEYINLFCDNYDLKYLDNINMAPLPLRDDLKSIIIDICYKCLNLKKGKMDIAKNILVYFNEISIINNYIIYNKNIDSNIIENNIFSLTRMGVTTIKIFDKDELLNIQKEFLNTLRNFPEYKRNPTNPDKNINNDEMVYVLGGFAALGNPSSFHNELVRELRIKCYNKVKNNIFKKLKKYYNINDLNLELLIDRMLYRMKTQAPSADPWHRDVTPSNMILDDDDIYGGWLNLDSVDQKFVCILGSHLGIKLVDLKEGFTKVNEKDIPFMKLHKKEIIIKPGHLIIFPQYILHDVVSKEADHNMMRLFIGWRLTKSNKPLIKDLKSRLINKEIIPLPSGQLPPMWGKLHRTNWFNKKFKPFKSASNMSLVTWSNDYFKESLLIDEKFTPKGGGALDENYSIIPRYMKGLKYYNIDIYKDYSDDELNFYKPNKL